MSLRVCISSVPLGSFGLHAEAIRGKIDEIAEIMTEGIIKGVRGGTLGYLGMSVAKIHTIVRKE